jgi:hypothetical protein
MGNLNKTAQIVLSIDEITVLVNSMAFVATCEHTLINENTHFTSILHKLLGEVLRLKSLKK